MFILSAGGFSGPELQMPSPHLGRATSWRPLIPACSSPAGAGFRAGGAPKHLEAPPGQRRLPRATEAQAGLAGFAEA